MTGIGPPPIQNSLNNLNSNISSINSQIATINTDLSLKAITFEGTLSIAITDWSSSAPYICTKTVSNILATDKIFVDINLANYSTTDAKISATENWVYLSDITAAVGKITFTCLENKPEVALSVLYKVVR